MTFDWMSIRGKLGVVFISFLLLASVSVLATALSIRTQAADAQVINLAGRQRALTERMTKAVLGIVGSYGTEYQEQLAGAVDQFGQALAVLLDGGSLNSGEQSVSLPAASDVAIRTQLQSVARLWQQLRPQLEAIQADGAARAPPPKAVSEVESLSALMFSEMDAAVQLIEAQAARKLARLQAVQVLFLASTLALLIASYLLTQRAIVRPVSALGHASQHIAHGDLIGPVAIEPNASGEVRGLARSLEEVRQRLQRSGAHLRQNRRQLVQANQELQQAHVDLQGKAELEHELELAREVQQSILPHSLPEVPGYHFAARSQPAGYVSGDFYDIFPLDKGRLGILMGDVSGKGAGAALLMALSRSLIRAEAKHSRSPERVLQRVHRHLQEMSQADAFVTAFYGVLDPAKGTLHYARAGHDRPLLASAEVEACLFLAAKGIVLGAWDQVDLDEDTVQLQPGDTLVLYSDGITEAFSPEGEQFGPGRLCDTVHGALHLGAQELLEHILEQVDQFQAGAAQHDDITLLVLKAQAAGDKGQ